ncbi:MAG: hypothetical protein H6702_05910 [Myxococcales bacterium]|nr:hypothetical protein [Myxococcales bacterium]
MSGQAQSRALLPFPVAYPLAAGMDVEAPPARATDNLIFATYQAVRFTALVLLADALQRGPLSPRASAALRGLRQPYWRDWVALADGLSAPPVVPTEGALVGLALGWKAVATTDQADASLAPLYEDLPGHGGRKAHSPIEAVWALRNTRAHRRATRIDDLQDEADRQTLLRLVPALIRRLLRDAEGVLWRRRPDGVHRLVGDTRSPEPDPSPALAAALDASTTVFEIGQRYLPVAPFIVDETELVAAPVDEAYMVDGLGPNWAHMLGVRRAHAERPHASRLMDAINEAWRAGSAKRTRRAWQDLCEAAGLTVRRALARHLAAGSLPPWYFERPRVQAALYSLLEAPQSGLLLVGGGGAGKTFALLRFAERLLDGADRPGAEQPLVVWLDGAHDLGPGAATGALVAAIARSLELELPTFELQALLDAIGRARSREMGAPHAVLIIDAVNESPRFFELLDTLDALLPRLAAHPLFKVVFSCRLGAYEAAQLRRGELVAQQPVLQARSHLLGFGDESGDPRLILRPLDHDDRRRAYRLRQTVAPATSAAFGYDDLPREVGELLSSPLLLQLFHDTWAGAAHPPHELHEAQLFGAWLTRTVNDDELRAALAQATTCCLARRRAWISRDEAEALNSDMADTREASTRRAGLDPIERLLDLGVLRRTHDALGWPDGYTFAHQRLTEQILYDHLRTQPTPPEQFVEWADWCASFDELRSAYVRLSDEGGSQRLASAWHAAAVTPATDAATDLLGRLIAQAVRTGRAPSEEQTRAWPPTARARLGLAASAASVHLISRGEAHRALQALLLARAHLHAAGEGDASPIHAVSARIEIDLAAAWALRFDNVSENERAIAAAKAAAIRTHDPLLLAEVHMVAARLARQTSRRAQARSACQAAREALGRAHPSRERDTLEAFVLNESGRACTVFDDVQAERYYQRAAQAMRRAISARPDQSELEFWYSAVCHSLGNIRARRAGRHLPNPEWERAFAVRNQLVKRSPWRLDYRASLSISLIGLANGRRARGDIGGAHDMYREALRLRQELVEREPLRNDRRFRVLSTYITMARAGWESERVDLLRHAREAMEGLRHHHELGQLRPARLHHLFAARAYTAEYERQMGHPLAALMLATSGQRALLSNLKFEIARHGLLLARLIAIELFARADLGESPSRLVRELRRLHRRPDAPAPSRALAWRFELHGLTLKLAQRMGAHRTLVAAARCLVRLAPADLDLLEVPQRLILAEAAVACPRLLDHLRPKIFASLVAAAGLRAENPRLHRALAALEDT